MPIGEDESARRAGANESLFREVNERAAELAGDGDTAAEFLCECARVECVERLRVPLREYEAVRAHPCRFIVVAGHEQPELERVVEEGPDWLVVEKVGQAGAVAAERDRGG